MTPQTPTPPAAGPKPTKPRRSLWLVFGVGVAGVAAGVWLVMTLLPRWMGNGTGGTVPGAPAGDARKIHATLFYVTEDGAELAPVNREVAFAGTPGEQARRIVEAELQPAPSGLYSPIPAGTKVRAVYLTPKGEAFVDLS